MRIGKSKFKPASYPESLAQKPSNPVLKAFRKPVAEEYTWHLMKKRPTGENKKQSGKESLQSYKGKDATRSQVVNRVFFVAITIGGSFSATK